MPHPTHRRDNAHEWFWNNVDRSTGCWLWQGTRLNNGRGAVWFEGKFQTAAAVAVQLIYGPIPDGQEVCHDCSPNPDDGSCIHPGHVIAGTHRENMFERWSKWREEHPGEKKRYQPKGTHPRYEENRKRRLAKLAAS